MMKMKKRIYIDMDGVLADYVGSCEKMGYSLEDAKHIESFYAFLEPIDGAIDAYNELNELFDVYILTTASWSNPDSFKEKIIWVKKYLPAATKRVILSHHKNLLNGDFLIDDRTVNGAAEFEGELIQFGSEKFKNWKTVVEYLKTKI